MKAFGCLLLVSGFFVVLTALVLMTSMQMRLGFVMAGVGVEVLGLALLMNAYKATLKERR